MPSIRCSPQNHNSETQQITDALEHGDHTVQRGGCPTFTLTPHLQDMRGPREWMIEYRGRHEAGGTQEVEWPGG